MYRWQNMRTTPAGWSYWDFYCLTHYKNQWLTAALRWWWSVSPLIILLFPVFLPLPLCRVVVVVFGQVMLLQVMATPMFWMVLPLMAEVSSVGWMLFSLGAAQHRRRKLACRGDANIYSLPLTPVASRLPGSVVMATMLGAVMIRRPWPQSGWTWHPSDRPLLVLDKR